MHVLIVGGTGLISTGITRQLADSEHAVTCFTRGESDADVPDAVEFVHGDRNERADLAAARDEVDPDCVVDMVCFAPDQAEQAIDVFAGAVDQYVFCSTVDVYHRPLDTNPVQEDAPRDLAGAERSEGAARCERGGTTRETPVSQYGADKAECEDLFTAAHDRGDFAATVIRPWSTYGEGGTVLHTMGVDTYFLDRIREGKPVIVHGDGQTLWGPCHRDDVARAFVNAVGNETAYGEAYHVTSEEVITWGQFYQTVADVMDAPGPEFVHVPTPVLAEAAPDRTGMLLDHFQFSTVFDNSKARRDLDFEYTVSFAEGVRRTIEALEANDDIEPWDSQNDDEIIAAWREATDQFLDSV